MTSRATSKRPTTPRNSTTKASNATTIQTKIITPRRDDANPINKTGNFPVPPATTTTKKQNSPKNKPDLHPRGPVAATYKGSEVQNPSEKETVKREQKAPSTAATKQQHYLAPKKHSQDKQVVNHLAMKNSVPHIVREKRAQAAVVKKQQTLPRPVTQATPASKKRRLVVTLKESKTKKIRKLSVPGRKPNKRAKISKRLRRRRLRFMRRHIRFMETRKTPSLTSGMKLTQISFYTSLRRANAVMR